MNPSRGLLLGLLAVSLGAAAVGGFLYWRGEPAEPPPRKPTADEVAPQLNDVDPQARRDAADLLSEMGPAAEPAIPALVVALKDRDSGVHLRALQALISIGPKAVPGLVVALEDPDPRAYRAGMIGLSQLGPAAVPALARELRHNHNGEARQRAAIALGLIGPGARPAVPTLAAALRNPNSGVRRSAAEALGKIGPAARQAVPDLRKAARDQNSAVRQAATAALQRIEEKR